MRLKILIPGIVVIGALFFFTGAGWSAGDGKVTLDQWTRVIEGKSAANANPDGFAAAMNRGAALREDKKYIEAIAAFSDAIRLDPQSSEAYKSRGNLRRAGKDYAGALNDYQTAVKLSPGNTGLMITLANVQIDMGRYDDALISLNNILAADPANLDALISRGYARKQIKDYAGARTDFQKVLEINPDQSFAARSLKSLEKSGESSAPPAPRLMQPPPAVAMPSRADLPAASTPRPGAASAVLPPASSKDGASRPPTPPPIVPQAKADDGTLKEPDPCKPDLALSDLVWSALEKEPANAQTPAGHDSRFQDLLVFSDSRHNHPITTAKAQLAYLMGDISVQDQAKFDAKWSFFFQYPSDETTAYFEKLIPLLADLIAKRNQATAAVLARNDAQNDADQARAFANAEAAADAEELVGQQTIILQELAGELKALAAALQALGDPPNPLARACKAKKKHEDAKKTVQDALKAAITPAKLKGKINVAYSFKPELSRLEDDTMLSWDFDDGETATALAEKDVVHTFKKGGKFLIKLSLIDPRTKEKIPIAEAKALIAGSASGQEGSDDKANTKFSFIAKDPFDVSGLPEGCKATRNEGMENKPIHGNESIKDHLSYSFDATVSCKEKNFTAGQATLENLVKPVPFRIYATSATINFHVQYYPPDNIFYKDRVQGLAKSLADQEKIKDSKYAPYKFKGWGANGQISNFWSVKTPLGKGADRIRHEVYFYGLGQERTEISFSINALVGYFEDSFGIDCRKDGSYCGNAVKNQIVDKFREGLREQLDLVRVSYYNDLEKLVAGMKLKGLPYPYQNIAEAPAIPEAQDSWLDDDGTPLTPEEMAKRRQQALIDAEKFYQSNVEILQKNLVREEADYEKEKDPDRRAAFFYRMMAIKADIQAEQDKISTLHTGQVVHTRTQYDDYTQNKFAERIKTEQEKYVKGQRDAAIIRKEAGKLTGTEREKALKFIDEKLNGKTLAKLDEETIKKVGDAIFNKTQGYNEVEAAKYEEEAYMWDDYLTRAERVKMAADIGMLGCSFLEGPMAISSAYDITTGYLQGGPKEAATQLLLQAGAFALGKYVGATAKAGAAAEEAALAAKTAAGKSANLTKSAAEELQIFRANRAQGEKVVNEFAELNQGLKKAYLGKASPDEIALIKKQIRDKTIEIQANPHAKNFLKYNNDKLTQIRFNRSIKNVHSQVEKKFYEKMKSDKYKWGDFEVKEMRNASSSGSVGMDYDIGLIEKPNFVKLPDGTMKPQYWLMKDGKPATRKMWQDEAQKCWNEAYQEITLQNAERSWENVTTKIHPESYQDLAVLEGNLNKVSKEWIQQTADVTRYKAMHMLKDGSMSKFEKLQEISRGTAKDLNTKLMPLLGGMQKTKQAAEAAEHWKKVGSVLEDFGKNNIDPITAERRLAELTGGKSIPEVVDDMSLMMESIVKLGKRP